MLRMKYYKNFKGNESFLLIIGNFEDYKNAANSFRKLEGCALTSSKYIAIEDLGPVDSDKLILTKAECGSFAKICEKLTVKGQKAHDYFSIKTLPDVDFLISCGEYASLP